MSIGSEVASLSRRADGTIREVGAVLVGDRAEHIEVAVRQLVAIVERDGLVVDLGAIRSRAAAEVDAMLAGEVPPGHDPAPAEPAVNAPGIVIEPPAIPAESTATAEAAAEPAAVAPVEVPAAEAATGA